MCAMTTMGFLPLLPVPRYRTINAAVLSPVTVYGSTVMSSAGKPAARNSPARYSAISGTLARPSSVGMLMTFSRISRALRSEGRVPGVSAATETEEMQTAANAARSFWFMVAPKGIGAILPG
jgi:hypothetical protein